MTLPIMTAYAAAALGLIQIILTVTTGIARRKASISIGDGGNQELLYKIRRHGNFIETTPIFLILLGLLEGTGGPTLVVTFFALLFPLARISHALGMAENGSLKPRIFGMLSTIISFLVLSISLVWHLQSL
ncbi:MAPEG family protein [Temperatibacter marinus]|uniref:MAPEG family protein n=1 Tax=Temperatibacter marinus TaxID=1456591 RepID=A0AA52EFK9_9PROT|nr:MAPEG family protein [Temperatibacter marinus]WND03810.1 MAPEG family protein [Temperatibacter marinus]